jgi:hypothetical protein
MAKSKKEKTMAEVTAGYEEFAKGKKQNKTGKQKFDAALNKVVKPRSAK